MTAVKPAAETGALDLDAIRQREQAASNSPWHLVDLRHQRGGQIRIFPGRGCNYIVANVLASGDKATADAEFIAAARTAIPALLAAVDSLAGALAELVRVNDATDGWPEHTAAYAKAREVLAAVKRGPGGAA